VTEDLTYEFEFVGHCLGDWLPNGTIMVADPTLDIRPFDVVNVALRNDVAGPWAELMNGAGAGFCGVCKYYMGGFEATAGVIHIVGQLAPPCVSLIPETAIEAMHKVVSAPGCAAEMSDIDAMAMDLIRLLSTPMGTTAINPTWAEQFQEMAA